MIESTNSLLTFFSLSYVFPKEVLKEAEKIKIDYDKKDREDYYISNFE